jgi:ParB-like chromosome segregation protein Spo0J
MAQHIEYWPIDKLVFYARNPRKNDAAVDRMCSSIREFGFKIPVLARSDGEVVDGHLRLKAARKLGIAEIPVILCDGNVLVLSGHKKRNQARRLQTGRRNAGCEGRVLYRDCS